MASKRPLKVFRTSAGFEDAYIAAPSQKAALAAWGAKRNLFAQGVAELVEDPELAKAALDRPGEVLRVPRGTTAQHLAAAATGKTAGKSQSRGSSPASSAPRPAKPKPRPSRAKLEAAQERLEHARRELDAGESRLQERIEALKEELARLNRQNAESIARLRADVDGEERAYRKALRDWEG